MIFYLGFLSVSLQSFWWLFLCFNHLKYLFSRLTQLHVKSDLGTLFRTNTFRCQFIPTAGEHAFVFNIPSMKLWNVQKDAVDVTWTFRLHVSSAINNHFSLDIKGVFQQFSIAQSKSKQQKTTLFLIGAATHITNSSTEAFLRPHRNLREHQFHLKSFSISHVHQCCSRVSLMTQSAWSPGRFILTSWGVFWQQPIRI